MIEISCDLLLLVLLIVVWELVLLIVKFCEKVVVIFVILSVWNFLFVLIL